LRRVLPGLQPILCTLFLIGGVSLERTAGAAAALPLYVLAYVAGGTGSAITAVAALRAFRVDVNLLMLIAAGGAAVLGEWAEGGILLFLFSTSNALEFYAMGRTRRAIRALMELRPAEALVRRDGTDAVLPVESLRIGDTMIVKPAERLAADGVVRAGASSVDQSPITGESIPVDVGPGSKVFAGTINQRGSLEIDVTRAPHDSTLARIIAMVEHAQSARSPTQRLIDRVGAVYALVVIAGAVATYDAFLLAGAPAQTALYRAITLLVVASPCAVVIATPAAVLSAIAAAARAGVLIKGGAHMEQLALARTVVFDKTGTLTVGRPAVTDMLPAEGVAEDTLLALAGTLESRSEHALADAVVRECRTRGVAVGVPDGFEAITGRGIRARVDGRRVRAGSEEFIRQEGVVLSHGVRARLALLRHEGKTPIVVADQALLGILAVADTLRPQAAQTVRMLRDMGIRRIVLLTGDHTDVARSVAAQLGIDEVRAGLLPDEKAAAVGDYRDDGIVVMVGDGVNDAPALATADVGIAMGGAGTDAAMETADVVLMGDDLRRLPAAIALSRRSRAVMIQSLVFASLVIAALIGVALGLGLRLAFGVVGHEGSTVIVVLNGLRLLGWRPSIADPSPNPTSSG
jgi:Cd2+/Zn2+-exporting ATPase